MKKHNNLPLYTMEIDPTTDEGVDFVAFVDRPAIQRTFLAFRAAQAAPMAFTVASEERRIVSGPLMLADTPIYRRNDYEDGTSEEFYVSFPPATIEAIVHKFFASRNQQNVNLMHDPALQVEGCTMFESFISDSRRGIAPMRGYEDAPEGSWFGSFVVRNEDVWKSVKDGTFTGFSVEGLFTRVQETPATDEQLLTQIIDILSNTD